MTILSSRIVQKYQIEILNNIGKCFAFHTVADTASSNTMRILGIAKYFELILNFVRFMFKTNTYDV